MKRAKRRLPPSLKANRLFREFLADLDRRCPVIAIPVATQEADLAWRLPLDPDPANYRFDPDDLDDD